MRLDEQTLKTIKKLAERYFGKYCEIRIFGSRVDDTQKGGDIEIYIKTDLKDVSGRLLRAILLNRAEKLGIIDSAHECITLRELRNLLTYE